MSSPVGATVNVSLRLDTPATDFLGRPNRIDIVELIAVRNDRSQVVYSGAPATTTAFSVDIAVPPGGLVVRARGRRRIEGEPALMFFTNPIRIIAALHWPARGRSILPAVWPSHPVRASARTK